MSVYSQRDKSSKRVGEEINIPIGNLNLVVLIPNLWTHIPDPKEVDEATITTEEVDKTGMME
jgi:hypothetical protein